MPNRSLQEKCLWKFSKGNIRKKTQSWCKSTSSALLSLVSCLPNSGSKKLLTQHRLTFVEKITHGGEKLHQLRFVEKLPTTVGAWDVCGSGRRFWQEGGLWQLRLNTSRKRINKITQIKFIFVAHPSSFFCCNCSEKIIDVISFQHCYSKQGWYYFQSAPITDQERCHGAKLSKNP